MYALRASDRDVAELLQDPLVQSYKFFSGRTLYFSYPIPLGTFDQLDPVELEQLYNHLDETLNLHLQIGGNSLREYWETVMADILDILETSFGLPPCEPLRLKPSIPHPNHTLLSGLGNRRSSCISEDSHCSSDARKIPLNGIVLYHDSMNDPACEEYWEMVQNLPTYLQRDYTNKAIDIIPNSMSIEDFDVYEMSSSCGNVRRSHRKSSQANHYGHSNHNTQIPWERNTKNGRLVLPKQERLGTHRSGKSHSPPPQREFVRPARLLRSTEQGTRQSGESEILSKKKHAPFERRQQWIQPSRPTTSWLMYASPGQSIEKVVNHAGEQTDSSNTSHKPYFSIRKHQRIQRPERLSIPLDHHSSYERFEDLWDNPTSNQPRLVKQGCKNLIPNVYESTHLGSNDVSYEYISNPNSGFSSYTACVECPIALGTREATSRSARSPVTQPGSTPELFENTTGLERVIARKRTQNASANAMSVVPPPDSHHRARNRGSGTSLVDFIESLTEAEKTAVSEFKLRIDGNSEQGWCLIRTMPPASTLSPSQAPQETPHIVDVEVPQTSCDHCSL